MKAIMLNLDTDAPVLGEDADWYHIESLTVFEAGLFDALEQTVDESDDDLVVPREHLQIALDTGALVYESLEGFATFFGFLSTDWLEQSWRDQGAGGPNEDSIAEERISEAWGDLAEAVRGFIRVFDRARHVNKFVNYEAVNIQR